MADNKAASIQWKMWVNNGEVLGVRKACVDSIEIDELCDGSDTCTVRITDPNFEYIEDNIYVDEASVQVEFWFDGDAERQSFRGYISAIDISFPESGSPTITLTCLDNSHLMNRSKKERSWDKVTRADVVRKVASEYGFSTNIESNYEFAVLDTISQSNQTDIEFLEGLAGEEREPFMCKLVGTTVVYKKKGLLQTPVTQLGYKVYPFDVQSFSPQINKETRKEEVSDGNVSSDKTLEEYTANDGNVSRDVQGESVKTSSTAALNDTSGNNGSNMVYDPVKREWVRKEG